MTGTTFVSNPGNYSIFKGELFWTPAGAGGVEVSLGNADKLSLTVKPEFIDHWASYTGIKSKDAVAMVSKSCELSVELDEMTAQNVSMYLFGTPVAQVESDPGYSTGATTQLQKISILSNSAVQGQLRYVGTNTVGKTLAGIFPNVIFKGGSTLELISEEWAKFALAGECLLADGGLDFGTIYQTN